MALLKVFRGESRNLPNVCHDGYVYFTTDDGKLYIDVKEANFLKRVLINPNADWNASTGTSSILNKPDNLGKIISNTTAYWNSQLSLIGEKDVIYIYTDYQIITDNNNQTIKIPGIKVGDGLAYLIDTPFINQLSMDHINDSSIHVSSEDRASWNNKVRAYYSQQQNGILVLTTS